MKNNVSKFGDLKPGDEGWFQPVPESRETIERLRQPMPVQEKAKEDIEMGVGGGDVFSDDAIMGGTGAGGDSGGLDSAIIDQRQDFIGDLSLDSSPVKRSRSRQLGNRPARDILDTASGTSVLNTENGGGFSGN